MRQTAPWQALSGADGAARRAAGVPAGFVALGCIVAAAGAFMLIFKLWSASPFAHDPIGRLQLPIGAPASPPTPGPVQAIDVVIAGSASFVRLSANATEPFADAVADEAPANVSAAVPVATPDATPHAVPETHTGARGDPALRHIHGKPLVLRLDRGRARLADEAESP